MGVSGPGTFETVANSHTNLFCCGHAQLADGRVLTAGGQWVPDLDPQHAPFNADLFDPALAVGQQWNNPATPPNMSQRRWYPTCTTLADGTVLVVEGISVEGVSDALIPERYTPSATTGGSWATLPSSASRYFPSYTLDFLAPDGRVFYAGGVADTRIIDPNAASPSWVALGNNSGHAEFDHCTAVMYEPGKVLKFGGSDGVPSHEATAKVSLINLNDATPAWSPRVPMANQRQNHNATLLPDGKVLVTGGHLNYNAQGAPIGDVLAAEVFNPGANTWTTCASMDANNPRKYHSTALLLQDGRVVAAGGDNYPTAQIFRPPYFDAGLPRPVIQSAPSFMAYNETYTLQYKPTTMTISRATLTRLGSVTHAFDQNQRFLELTVTSAAGLATVIAPPNANQAPPGYYMLWLLSDSGVPSVAAYVRIGAS